MSSEPRPAQPMLDHLQAGLDAIDYGLALWTADGRLAWCNVKFRELFHGIADCLPVQV